MEIKLDIMAPFFRNPSRGFLIRELAKITGFNHMTIRKFVLYYLKEGLLIKRRGGLYDTFIANTDSRKYLNLKTYFNLELLRRSGLVETLEREFHYPPIKLFGSFAKALDTEQSDVDICIITNVKKEIDLKPHEKVLDREVNLSQFTEKSWHLAKKKNSPLLNNISNGITLSGQMEFL